MKFSKVIVSGLLATHILPLPAAAEVDFSDPEKVVSAIFAAAKTGDDTALATLCDPQGENDGDTQQYICEMKATSTNWAEYVSYFARGQVSGPAVITSDTAAVPFLFGPEGRRKETMNMVKRDGKWFLSSF